MKEDNISNISCYKVRDYFFLCTFIQQKTAVQGLLLSTCRQGPALSAVAIASRRAADDTSAKITVVSVKYYIFFILYIIHCSGPATLVFFLCIFLYCSHSGIYLF